MYESRAPRRTLKMEVKGIREEQHRKFYCTYETHIITEQSSPPFFILFPQEPHAIPLVIAEVGIYGSWNLSARLFVKNQSLFMLLLIVEWETWFWTEFLENFRIN